jgi:hypothetical protein
VVSPELGIRSFQRRVAGGLWLLDPVVAQISKSPRESPLNPRTSAEAGVIQRGELISNTIEMDAR